MLCCIALGVSWSDYFMYVIVKVSLLQAVPIRPCVHVCPWREYTTRVARLWDSGWGRVSIEIDVLGTYMYHVHDLHVHT